MIPKQIRKHGLKRTQLLFEPGAVSKIIQAYTREAGVRKLEQMLAKVCRKAARRIASQEEKRIKITVDRVEEFLGTPQYKKDLVAFKDSVGLVNGLAWTSVGGEILEAEVNTVPGTGKIEITGNLGTVMQESAKASMTYVRSVADRYGIGKDFYKNTDIHIHFPEAAIPKDGPSAGVTITTAIVSSLTGVPVRHDVAMTGEVTLRGRVLPIGGLKEKTMAAYRAGIKTVIIPEENRKDLADIEPVVRENLKFVTAETMDTVLEYALLFREDQPMAMPIPVQDEKDLTTMRQ